MPELQAQGQGPLALRNEVTLVSGAVVTVGQEALYAEAHEAGIAAAAALGGLARAELIPAVPGVQDDTVALMTFSSREHLDRWLASPEREATLAAMSRHTHGERRLNVVSGFPGWLSAAGAATPARWRQATLVVLGLIPVAFAVAWTREHVAPDLPLLESVVVSSVLNVSALTWWVMPTLNRRFNRWLFRAPTSKTYGPGRSEKVGHLR